jgi:4-hydroxy-3-methylbut-2-enyl diphosphate reductase IspH
MVGITSGTSTPDFSIDDIKKRLETLSSKGV